VNVEVERAEARGGPTPEHVREIAKRFHVHCEVYPELRVLHDHTTRQVGFCLELYGRVSQDSRRDVCLGLREISSFIVPATEGAARYEIDENPAAVHYCGNEEGGRPCVQLAIRILHHEGSERPVDEIQARALKEMEHRLEGLGVSRGGAA
jgi:hypothetical protein